MALPASRATKSVALGEPARSANRDSLVRLIGWRIQVLEQGGLSERAQRRAEELTTAVARYGDPAMAVEATNRQVAQRSLGHKFASLWTGVFNEAEDTLCFADTEHWLWIVVKELAAHLGK